jgi:quinol monooxygenase YgiN
MFARFLELTVKPDRKTELLKKMRDDVVPILKKHAGFIDVLPLEVEGEPTKIYAVSLWRDKPDAEKYEKENFARVDAIYEPFLTMPIVTKHCRIDETIFKRVLQVAA